MDFVPKRLYSSLSINRIYTIYNLQFPENYIFQGESHDFWELGYITEGEAGVTSDENIFHLKEGELFLQKPNMFHTSWAMNNKKYRIFIITFNGEGFKYSMPGGKFTLNEKEKTLMRFLIEEVPDVYSGFDVNEYEKLKEIASPGDEGYQIIKNYTELLCLSLKRRGKEALSAPFIHETPHRFSDSIKFLRENICNNLNIEEISKNLSESPSSLKSIFKQFTGGGIMKYYNYLRCQHSIQLLGDGYSVREISDIMNFSSQNYFSFFFKRETGICPTDYLKQKYTQG